MEGVIVWLPGPSEPDVVARLDEVPGVRVTRRCADLAELLGAARAGLGAVAVLALGRGVDRARLAELSRAGSRTVLVAAPADLHRAGALGAHALVPEGRDLAETVAGVVADLVARASAPERGPAAGGLARSASSGADAPERRNRPPGGLLAVWGGHGAPGRSTLAVTLSAELVRLGQEVVLLDADTAAPSLSQALGLLEENAGIAALSRAAGQGTLDTDTLRRRAVALPSGASFVSGLTRADRWRELPPEHVDVVLETCRAHADWTIVDCAAGIEAQPQRGADRFAVTRSVLRAASLVLVVAGCDVVGVRRAVQALTDLDAVHPGVPRRVVLSVTRPTPSRHVSGCAEALERFAAAPPAWTVPYDAAVGEALLAAATVTQAAPRSPARRVCAEIAATIVGAAAPAAGPAARRGPGRVFRLGG